MNCATVDRHSLISGIKRVQNFSDSDSMLVKMEFTETYINISTEDAAMAVSAQEKIPCTYEGEELKIGFKSISLMNMLNALKSEEVAFYVSDTTRPGVIEPTDEEEGCSTIMMLMPMIIND